MMLKRCHTSHNLAGIHISSKYSVNEVEKSLFEPVIAVREIQVRSWQASSVDCGMVSRGK